MQQPTLRRKIAETNGPVRAIGVHDGLSAIMAEQAGFEALWAGGLGISTAHGVPDAGILTMTELLADAVRIRRSSPLPVIADVDSGFGDTNTVRRMVKLYESAGVDAVCIEDKQYPKRNSFRGGNVLEDPNVFARKLEAAKDSQHGEAFMVIARLESLIAGAGQQDALARALLYAKAGADALLIHSRQKTPVEIGEFCAAAKAAGIELPIFIVPTTYHTASADELHALGADGIIYANHLIRGATTAMSNVLASLARTGSTTEMEGEIAGLNELFDLVGTGSLDGDEPWQGLAAEPAARH